MPNPRDALPPTPAELQHFQAKLRERAKEFMDSRFGCVANLEFEQRQQWYQQYGVLIDFVTDLVEAE